MIFYLVTQRYANTLHAYLRTTGRLIQPPLGEFLTLLPYEKLVLHRYLAPGTYIFADLERLSPAETKQAGLVWERLQEAGQRTLNNPLYAMRRYELLRTLYEAGINSFNVYRATECRQPASFPVFIHSDSDHQGSHSTLLHNQAELDAALENVLDLGLAREETLIEEYCDLSVANDLYRKYAAYRIGERILAHHMQFSTQWQVKGGNKLARDAAMAGEESAFMHNNPHEDQLRSIFDLARIEFGRMDYGIKDGRVQVWEINTNPSRTPVHLTSAGLRARRFWYAGRLHDAYRAVDTPGDSTKKIPNPIYRALPVSVLDQIVNYMPRRLQMRYWFRQQQRKTRQT